MILEQVGMRFQTGGECGQGWNQVVCVLSWQTSNLEKEFGGTGCGLQLVGLSSWLWWWNCVHSCGQRGSGGFLQFEKYCIHYIGAFHEQTKLSLCNLNHLLIKHYHYTSHLYAINETKIFLHFTCNIFKLCAKIMLIKYWEKNLCVSWDLNH